MTLSGVTETNEWKEKDGVSDWVCVTALPIRGSRRGTGCREAASSAPEERGIELNRHIPQERFLPLDGRDNSLKIS